MIYKIDITAQAKADLRGIFMIIFLLICYHRRMPQGSLADLKKYQGINFGGKRSGHEISVIGLIRAKKVLNGNTWNYLMVYNS